MCVYKCFLSIVNGYDYSKLVKSNLQVPKLSKVTIMGNRRLGYSSTIMTRIDSICSNIEFPTIVKNYYHPQEYSSFANDSFILSKQASVAINQTNTIFNSINDNNYIASNLDDNEKFNHSKFIDYNNKLENQDTYENKINNNNKNLSSVQFCLSPVKNNDKNATNAYKQPIRPANRIHSIENNNNCNLNRNFSKFDNNKCNINNNNNTINSNNNDSILNRVNSNNINVIKNSRHSSITFASIFKNDECCVNNNNNNNQINTDFEPSSRFNKNVKFENLARLGYNHLQIY